MIFVAMTDCVAALRHRPTRKRTIKGNIQCAVGHRIACATASRPSIVWRENAAYEGDERDPVSLIVAERI